MKAILLFSYILGITVVRAEIDQRINYSEIQNISMVEESTKEIKIIAYNAFLFKGTLLSVLIGRKDKERIRGIISELRNMNLDIIALSEIWADKTKALIAKELADIYPHAFYQTTKWNSYGNGLLLLTKYSIEEAEFHLFRGQSLGKKGFIHAKLALPDGNTKLWVISTHTKAFTSEKDREKRLQSIKHISEYAEELLKKETNPLFLMGDLNVHGESEEYVKMNNILSRIGLSDCYRVSHSLEDNLRGSTMDTKVNPMTGVVGLLFRHAMDCRLDYIYSVGVHVLDCQVCYTFKKDNLHYSDHFPLYCKLKLL